MEKHCSTLCPVDHLLWLSEQVALGWLGWGLRVALPPPWVYGSHVGPPWPGTCLQLGLPGWRKGLGAGLRPAESGLP